MPNTTTKSSRAKRLDVAKRMLIAAGFTPDGGSAAGLIVDALMKRFNITDRRTARVLEAKAARLLRGDAVNEELGRPRTQVTLRDGETVEVIETSDGEVINSSNYIVRVDSNQVSLSNDERILILREAK